MIIYRTYSFIQATLNFFLNVGYLAVACYASYNFKENPILATIAIFLSIFSLLIAGKDEVIVYPDIVVYKSGSIIKSFRKKRKFRVSEIKSIDVSGNYDTYDEIHNPTMKRAKSLNRLVISLKDGQVITIHTDIYISNLKKASIEVNSLLS